MKRFLSMLLVLALLPAAALCDEPLPFGPDDVQAVFSVPEPVSYTHLDVYKRQLMYLFYRESFIAGDKGFGSAVVVWTVLLIGVTTLFQFTSQQRWVHYES